MGAFKLTKDMMMLLVTMFVLIFVSVFFYYVLGYYRIGSGVYVEDLERELVMLRTLRCLEKNEKLDVCMMHNKYAVIVELDDKTIYNNKKLWNELWANYPGLEYKLGNKPEIGVLFKNG